VGTSGTPIPLPLPQISTTTTTTTTTAYPYLYPATAILSSNSSTGYPLVSTNGGYTWNLLTTFGYKTWSAIAQNVAQSYIVGSVNGTGIYVSSDGGATAPTLRGTGLTPLVFNYLAVSLTGQYIVAQGSDNAGSYIMVSNDFGATFTNEQNFFGANLFARGIAVSGNGQYMQGIAFTSTGSVGSYRSYSTNYGATWGLTAISTGQDFQDVAINNSGQYMVIVAQASGSQGRIFISTNYGSSYTEKLYDNANPINFCVISSNGQYGFAVSSNGTYYYSKDITSAGTWVSGGTIGMAVSGLTMNSNGDYVVIYPSNSANIFVFPSTNYESGYLTIPIYSNYPWKQIDSGSN
jgi:hypothetical protein